MSTENENSSYKDEEVYPSETQFDDSKYPKEITGNDVIGLLSNPEIMNSITDITKNLLFHDTQVAASERNRKRYASNGCEIGVFLGRNGL